MTGRMMSQGDWPVGSLTEITTDTTDTTDRN